MGNFFPDFQYYKIEGKKSRVFFVLQKFHQNAENKYERGILYHNILVSFIYTKNSQISTKK
jgi:hypothetical protein